MQPALPRARFALALLALALLGAPSADAGMGFGNPKRSGSVDGARVELLIQSLLTGALIPR